MLQIAARAVIQALRGLLEVVELILRARHPTPPLGIQLLHHRPHQPARARCNRFARLRIKEAHKEERDACAGIRILLPGYSSEGGDIDLREQIAVAVASVADEELGLVGFIVHVPAEDHGAEAEAGFEDREELLLGDDLAYGES